MSRRWLALGALLLPLAFGTGELRAAEEDAADAADLLITPAAGAREIDGSMLAAEPQETREPAEPAGSAPSEEEEAATTEDDEVVWPAFPLSRYAILWERSPFQVESIAPPEMSEGLAQRYALTGIAEISGEPIAFLMERATQNRLMVRSDGGSGDLELVQVDVQSKYSDSTATVRRGAEVGVVKFDAMAAMPSMPQPGMPQPGMPQPGMPQPGMPQVIPQPGQIPRPPQAQAGVAPVPGAPQPVVPGQPVPGQPVVPGAVPGQVNGNGQVQAPLPGQQDMPPPRVIRRRALIPSAP